MPQPFYSLEEVWNRIKPDPALSKSSPAHDLCKQFVVPEEQLLSHSDLATGTYQALPIVGGL